MSTDIIEYVRLWKETGNEPRFATTVSGREDSGVESTLPEFMWEMLDKHEDTFCWLSKEGLAIAALSERDSQLLSALRQANNTAEHVGEYESYGEQACDRHSDAFETMRRNLTELDVDLPSKHKYSETLTEVKAEREELRQRLEGLHTNLSAK